MEQNYTEKVLIRYIYKEADFFEKLEVENAIENDHQVNKLYKKLNGVLDILPKVKFTPSQEIINQILFSSKNAELLA